MHSTDDILPPDDRRSNGSPRTAASGPGWYALVVRARFEQIVARNLAARNCGVFLPLARSRRRWSDRIKVVETPLFPGYVLAHFDATDRRHVVTVPGVLHIVSTAGAPCRIADEDLTPVRAVVDSIRPAEPWPFLPVGRRVRVTSGALADLEGFIVQARNSHKLIVSVNLLQRSVAVEIDPALVEPVARRLSA